MGAMVTVIYGNDTLNHDEAWKLSEGLRAVIVAALGDEDVFVYANNPQIAVAAQPIEVFIQVNSQKAHNPSELIEKIASGLTDWKQNENFDKHVNLNVVPVDWYSMMGI